MCPDPQITQHYFVKSYVRTAAWLLWRFIFGAADNVGLRWQFLFDAAAYPLRAIHGMHNPNNPFEVAQDVAYGCAQSVNRVAYGLLAMPHSIICSNLGQRCMLLLRTLAGG